MKNKAINSYMKPNKYHSKKATYNGYTYHSTLEANYARQLDWQIKEKEVKSWERQYKIDITVNGIHITNYFIDFKVYYTDGHVEYIEIKGFETGLWRIKWRLAQAMYPDYTFRLIK